MYVQSDVKNVFLYLRQSTEEKKGRQVNSIRDQRQACHELADRLGLNIIDEFKEEISAYEPYQRPVFDAMLKELEIQNPKKRRADGILAWHPDRLSRNPIEAGKILYMIDKDQIKDMFFCSYMFHNSSSGKEHLFMEFARAKGYSDKLSDNVTRGQKGREKEGAILYSTKFGYDKLREDPKNPKKCSLFPIPNNDFEMIQRIFQLRLKGLSAQLIREQLEKEGITRANGKGIPKVNTIYDYLKDTFYYGLMVIKRGHPDEREVDFRNISINGTTFIPAVSEEDFWACQRITEKDQPKKKVTKHKHPLSGGLLKCGHCGSTLYPAARKVKKQGIVEKQLGYECQTKGCAQPRIKTDTVIFPAIKEDLKQGLYMTEQHLKMFLIGASNNVEAKRKERKRQRKRNTELLSQVERDLNKLEQEKASLARLGEYDADAKAQHEAKKKELKAEKKNYHEREEELRQDFEETINTFTDLLELSQNAHQYWANANDVQKNKIAEILYLNLTFKDKEIASLTLKPPFAGWRKEALFRNGGHAGT